MSELIGQSAHVDISAVTAESGVCSLSSFEPKIGLVNKQLLFLICHQEGHTEIFSPTSLLVKVACSVRGSAASKVGRPGDDAFKYRDPEVLLKSPDTLGFRNFLAHLLSSSLPLPFLLTKNKCKTPGFLRFLFSLIFHLSLWHF